MGKTNLIIKSMLCRTLILFPQMSQSASRDALLYVFEDNDAVIKMIMNRQKSNTETCFPNS